MKRLNKKGFTLVELLAAIVILAVLMLVGAQAVGTILNNSNANSLVNSLDMAVKQGTMKYAEGTLSTCENGFDKLHDVLTYDEKQYEINACYSTAAEHLTVKIIAKKDGKFKNTKCSHGNIPKLDDLQKKDANGNIIGEVAYTTSDDKKKYKFECYNATDTDTFYIVKRVDITD